MSDGALSQAEPGGERWGLPLATLVAGMFMVLLDSSIVNIAVPVIQTDFHMPTTTVQWIVSLYLVVLGVATPASGWLADRLGYKRLYVAAVATFTVGSLFSAASPTFGLLLVGRGIQAIGGGMIPPATTTLLFRMVPKHQLGVANGYRGIATMMAPALGPTIGGYLVQYVDWRWIFTINLPVGIAGVILGLIAIPELKSRSDSRFDPWGFATLTASLVPLLLALADGSVWGWRAPLTLGLLGCGVAFLAVFVAVELRSADPLLDLRVMRYATFAWSLVFAVIINVAVFGVLFFLPLYLELADGMGALRVGLILLPAALATAVLAPVSGRLYDRFDAPVLVLAGTALLAVSTYLFHGLGPRTTAGTVTLWATLRGAGLGLCLMPMLTAGMSVVPAPVLARAAALRNVAQRVASSFGIALLTAMTTGEVAARMAAARAAAPGSPAAGAVGGAAAAAAHHLAYLRAFTVTIDHLFVVLAAVVVLGMVPACFIRGDRGRAAARPGGAAVGRSLPEG